MINGMIEDQMTFQLIFEPKKSSSALLRVSLILYTIKKRKRNTAPAVSHHSATTWLSK